MHMEDLDRRRLFSVSLTKGVLSIVGTEKNDSILVERVGTNFIVTSSVDGVKKFPLKKGDSIRIDGRGGNDTLHNSLHQSTSGPREL